MGKEKRLFCWCQNFVPKGLYAPALGLYTCIKALKYIPCQVSGEHLHFTGPLVLWFVLLKRIKLFVPLVHAVKKRDLWPCLCFHKANIVGPDLGTHCLPKSKMIDSSFRFLTWWISHSQIHYRNDLLFSNRQLWANSADHDQSSLFAIMSTCFAHITSILKTQCSNF